MKSTKEDDRVHEIREAAESVEAFAVVSFRRTLLEKEFEEKALNALKSASNSENWVEAAQAAIAAKQHLENRTNLVHVLRQLGADPTINRFQAGLSPAEKARRWADALENFPSLILPEDSRL